jgi:hypothetical protein
MYYDTEQNLGDLGISVKVKVPKEIREASKALPGFQKSFDEISKQLPQLQKTFGPATKEAGRFNTVLESYREYVPWVLIGGGLLIFTLIMVNRRRSGPS